MNSLILRTTSRFLVVLTGLFSLYVLFRGHNAPGGGFIGGLLLAGAYAIYGMANGKEAVARILPMNLHALIGIGVFMSIASGILGLVAGDSFLTGQWSQLSIPGIGKLSSVLIFDVGVYIVVFATALSIILALAEEQPQ